MSFTLAEKLVTLYKTSRPLEFTESNGAIAIAWSNKILQQLERAPTDVLNFKAPIKAPAAKERTCKKGFACGGSCIAKGKKCKSLVDGDASIAVDYLDKKLPKTSKSQQTQSTKEESSPPSFSTVEYNSSTKRQIDAWESASKKIRSAQDTSQLTDNAEIIGLIKDEADKANFVGIKDKNGKLQAASTVKDKGDHIYVDYLATAPWNLTAGQDKRSVKGAGASAMEAIIDRSIKSGHKGAVKLEALEGAVGFYNKVGFVEKRRKTVFGLTTIEMELAPAAARKFLKKRGK